MASFCLLHGKWHGPQCWAALQRRLGALGHDSVAPDLPIHDPSTTHADRVAPAVAAVDATPPPHVIVGHSLAAAYAPLVALARSPALLVYLCPAPVGPFSGQAWATRATRPGFPFPRDDESGRSEWDRQAAIDVIYPRLPPDVAGRAADALRPGAAPSDHYPLEDHPPVASALVYATEDEFFEPAWERHVASAVLGVEPVEIAGGHFPMLEDPDALARVLVGLSARHA